MPTGYKEYGTLIGPPHELWVLRPPMTVPVDRFDPNEL